MILLTGSTGFIGSAISRCLDDRGVVFKGVSHHKKEMIKSEKAHYAFQINSNTDWLEVLTEVDVVVHTAGKAHVMNGVDNESLAEYRMLNVDSTLNLARQCVENGVKRFVFISTINVNGTFTVKPFTESDDPNPINAFARFKWEAEKALWDINQSTEMEVIIIRCPIVYGPSVPGNFGSLVKLIKKKIPLPLGAVNNKRSFLALDNLVDFVGLCINYKCTPQAANQVFLISDGEDISTTELFRRISKAYGIKNYLLPVPTWFLRLVAIILGKKQVAARLLDSLQLDASKARTLLSWKPVVTMDKQLSKMADLEII